MFVIGQDVGLSAGGRGHEHNGERKFVGQNEFLR